MTGVQTCALPISVPFSQISPPSRSCKLQECILSCKSIRFTSCKILYQKKRQFSIDFSCFFMIFAQTGRKFCVARKYTFLQIRWKLLAAPGLVKGPGSVFSSKNSLKEQIFNFLHFDSIHFILPYDILHLKKGGWQFC